LGRRAQKTVNSVLTQFRYDGLDAIQETGTGGDTSYLRTLSIDEALARTDAGGTVHYLGDALGSSVALTTPGGTAAATYTYEPFGRTEVTGTPNPNPFRFTGREDDGTGLYYYRARYYDPSRSRFISEDPIGLAGGMNLFAYVRNDPVNRVDPSGKWAHLLAELLVETLENAFPHKANESKDELEALRREKEITNLEKWWKGYADYMECLNRTLDPGKCRNLRPDDLSEPTNGCKQ
jgi:RHS repeat-associated protein